MGLTVCADFNVTHAIEQTYNYIDKYMPLVISLEINSLSMGAYK